MFLGDLLGAQMLAHRLGEEGAALHGRVVGDQHAGAALHDADAGDDAGARHLVAVEPPGREGRELEEGRLRVEQQVDALAHHDLAAGFVSGAQLLAASQRDEPMAESGGGGEIPGSVCAMCLFRDGFLSPHPEEPRNAASRRMLQFVPEPSGPSFETRLRRSSG